MTDLVRAVLERHGGTDWTIRSGEFWCHVSAPRQRRIVQGWKLHVSATPRSAPIVLERAAEVLVRRGCSFKFAPTVDRVTRLVAKQYDRAGGGKFITVYPDLDGGGLRDLADELHRVTAGLPGPGILSDRPVRPGSLVHYRFGAIDGVPMLSNDGTYEAHLVAPDGRLELDRREAWFSPPSWAPPDPFEPPRPTTIPAPATPVPTPVLLNGRYVVRHVIRHGYAGGVFRATDRETGAEVVIKQGRAHAASDVTGRDMRDSLRHEAAMLARFAGSGLTPRPVDLFEQQGDRFLVQEAIDGTTLRTWVGQNVTWAEDGTWGLPVATAVRLAAQLIDLVGLVHDAGLTLQDFSPNNVVVTPAGEPRLVDLELLAPPGAVVTRGYTVGYAAPEQLGGPKVGPAPDLAADRFALGATLFYLVSGVDPVLPSDDPPAREPQHRFGWWLDRLGLGNPAARQLRPVIVALMSTAAERRPELAEVRRLLDHRPSPAVGPPRRSDRDLDAVLADGLGHLLATMTPENPARLWPSGEFGHSTDPCNVQHGAAGVLCVLVRICREKPSAPLHDAVGSAAAWIADRLSQEPRVLPGLYFGRAGTAWSLLEAGVLRGDPALVDAAADLARRLPLSWPNPDVCHGLAGTGLTLLRFFEATGDPEFLDRAAHVARSLVAVAEHDAAGVRWRVPHDVPSALAGIAHYGFAHGVAGIGTFLLAAGRATSDARVVDLAAAAADTLVRAAQVERGAAYWPSSADAYDRHTNWCSGSSGVGTFLLRMWTENPSTDLEQLLDQAAVAVHRTCWQAGTAQCHGLAGDGEFLLDLAATTGDQRYRAWARELAASIAVRHALRHGRRVPPDDSGTEVTADFGTGLAGVVAYLWRLRHGGSRPWLPENLVAASPTAAARIEERR